MSVFHTTTASKLMASGLEAEHCKYFHSLQLFTESQFPMYFRYFSHSATHCYSCIGNTVRSKLKSEPVCFETNQTETFLEG